MATAIERKHKLVRPRGWHRSLRRQRKEQKRARRMQRGR